MLNVLSGPQVKPLRVVLYGPEGVGKTTFAADAPGAIFLGAEEGTEELDVRRFPTPSGWDEILEAVALVSRGVPQLGKIGTLVIDTLDAVERMIYAAICNEAKVDTIEQVGGGYGKGYSRALDYWEQLLKRMDTMQAKQGTHVIMLAHAQLAKVTNPHGADYHRAELKLNAKAGAMVKEWSRDVLFANFEVRVNDGKDLKKKGKATGKRLIYTAHSAGYDAKTRATLPETLPLSFAAFWDARERSSKARGATPTCDQDLVAEVTAAVAQLPEAMQVDAKGMALVQRAQLSGDVALRKLLNWALCKLDTIAEDGGDDGEPQHEPGSFAEHAAERADEEKAFQEGMRDEPDGVATVNDDTPGDEPDPQPAPPQPVAKPATAKASAPAPSKPPTGSQPPAAPAGSTPAGASGGATASAPKKAARKAAVKS